MKHCCSRPSSTDCRCGLRLDSCSRMSKMGSQGREDMKFEHLLFESIRYGLFKVKDSCLSMSHKHSFWSQIHFNRYDWVCQYLFILPDLQPLLPHCSQYHNLQTCKTLLKRRFVALIEFLAARDHDMHCRLTGLQPTDLVPCKLLSPGKKKKLRNRKIDPTDHDLLTALRALVLI